MLNHNILKWMNVMIPCIYLSLSRAWITGDRFVEYLYGWDTKLKDSKIVLLPDHFAALPKDVNLINIKLAFLPPNTTSALQPLNQRIIQVLKQDYRKRVVQQYLSIICSLTCLHKQIDLQINFISFLTVFAISRF